MIISGLNSRFDYFGIRYYSSDLSVWLSVDPLADKYPGISAYAYCALNPIIYIDQNGDSIQNTASSDFAGSVALINSLSEKTGLNLSYNDNNMIVYEKDKNGNPVINGGSKSARDDLIKGIEDDKFTYSIGWNSNTSSIDGGKSTLRGKNDVAGFVYLDIADFSENDNKTFDIGMVFLHEYNHGYYGLIDNYTPATVSGRDKPDFYDGAGIFKLGNPGETVLRVNIYRKELGLAQRRTYEAIDGKLLFSKSYKFINKRGKVKIRTKYFTLPVFSK